MMDCIEWTGSKDAYGYGQIRRNNKLIKAHRVALAEDEGIELPPSSVKCRHSCDNPGCINPKHLSWGTQRDNIQDAVERGRMRKKLTLAQHAAIKIDTRKLKEISAEYKVTEATVSRIRNGIR
jgi:hypothetical protein